VAPAAGSSAGPLADIVADLRAESDAVDVLVAGLDDAGWRTATPSPGWTVAHQIAHLSWTDDIAVASAVEPDRFAAVLRSAAADPAGYVDQAADTGAARAPADLLRDWRAGRAALADALGAVPAGQKLPWFGPPMSAASMATARLMETWAHGLDVADALGAPVVATSRLRHVAHIGVRTRDFAYLLRDRTPPADPFRVELTGPAGERWAWGPQDAAQRVTGTALDFCLLVTQRRHRGDLAVTATGPDADEWLDIAQAFAGLPGAGRQQGQFA
jgi:uncharacterized protein (TIGR03084 family)